MKAIIYRRKSQEDKGRQALSFENQHRAIARLREERPNLEIVRDFEEARTAAKPGRPLFNEALRLIEAGEASMIIAYGPDRLSRNAVDAGLIVDMLDRGVLKDLAFCTYTFENTPAGKFMLQMMLVQSKYYSDALSVNVREGLATKLAKGWMPGRVPFGYEHDRNTKTVVPNPGHFELVRRMFTMVLAGTHSPSDIHQIAQHEWGFLTPQTNRSGGKPLALSTVYKILKNPFYAGLNPWKGVLHQGKHEAVLPLDEFLAVQERIARPGKARPQTHRFPYTGLIRCRCGLMVTAERKTNRYGSTYVYYHCTRRRGGGRCRESAVSVATVESEIVRFLGSIVVHPRVYDWVLEQIRWSEEKGKAAALAHAASVSKALSATKAQAIELTRLRLRNLIDDGEFEAERQRLEMDRLRLEREEAKVRTSANRIEPLLDVVRFSIQAVHWFSTPDLAMRRLVVETAGSNPTLSGKMLSIQAAKPFRHVALSEAFLQWCGDVEDVRNPEAKLLPEKCPEEMRPAIRRYIAQTLKILEEPEGVETVRKIRRLRAVLGLSPAQSGLAA